MYKDIYETIVKIIEQKLEESKADYKDCEKKIEKYKICYAYNIILNSEQEKWAIQQLKREERKCLLIDEYKILIVNELTKQNNLVSDLTDLKL